MARKRLRARRGAAAWQGTMEQQAASGLSRKEFCEREGIPRSSFETWRRRLASRAVAGQFVDLTSAAPAGPKGWDLEVALPGGITLRFRG